jgi:hypothetical protein
MTEYAISFDGSWFRVVIKSGGTIYESTEFAHLADALVWPQKKIGAMISIKLTVDDEAGKGPPFAIPMPR